MRRILKGVVVAGFVFGIFLFLNNTSRFTAPRSGTPAILVHRGVAQRYSVSTASADTCIVRHMLPPEHEYLENTIPSMRAAFERGADVVEIDVQATRDRRFAVFHDRTLDCRTDGRGPVRDRTVAELAMLDVGYGYTADGGRTYPFRGKGQGMLRSLDEVLETFPDRSFLIDIKGNIADDGVLLADHLSRLPAERRATLMVFGRESTLAAFRVKSDIRNFSTESIAGCLVRYIAYGWSGAVPSACDGSPIFVPVNVMSWLWGWPNKFLDRFASRDIPIIVMGPLGGYDFPAGIDTVELLKRLPVNFNGGIWTNNVDLVAAGVKGALSSEGF